MSESKRQIVAFSFFDKRAIERRLEKESEKGWMIEKPGNFIWKYRAAEPKKRHVSLVYFPDASEYDPKPTAGQEMMNELCARDGWECAATWGQMMFFYNEQKNPDPIETDPLIQVENIHSGMKKTMLPQHVLMILLCAFQLYMNYSNYSRDAVEYLSNGAQLYMGPAWVLLMLTAVSELVRYNIWYRRAKSAAENGEFYEQRVSNFYAWIFDGLAMVFILSAAVSLPYMGWAMLLWLAVVVGTGCSIRLISGYMKKRGASRNTNRNISVAASVMLSFIAAGVLVAVFLYTGRNDSRAVGTYNLNGWDMDVYADAIPLRIEDYMDVDCDEWSTYADKQETILVKYSEYRQDPLSSNKEIPDLRYSIADIKVKALEETVRKAHHPVEDPMLPIANRYDAIDPAPWYAEEAFRYYHGDGYRNSYLLYYPARVVAIRFAEEPTLEQSKIIGEILAP